MDKFQIGELVEVSNTNLQWIKANFIGYDSTGKYVCETENGNILSWVYMRKVKTKTKAKNVLKSIIALRKQHKNDFIFGGEVAKLLEVYNNEKKTLKKY